MTDSNSRVPLEEVAGDLRPLIAAFRAAGEISFQDVPLEQSRANYRAGCAANGLPPEEVALVRDHPVPVAGSTITLREYRPATGDEPLAAVFFVHGGGWVIGDLETHDRICRFIAAKSGLAVFAVDYRLAPEFPFPVPLQDCAEALGWLVANAARLKIRADAIRGVGDSAGGNLVAVLAADPALRPAGFDFSALALLYPVTDLRARTASYRRIAAGFPLTRAGMEWFAGHYLPPGTDQSDPRVSPLLGPMPTASPLFIVSCGLDPLSDEGIAYAHAAGLAGLRVEHHHLPGHAHGLFTSAGKIATGKGMTQRLADFLAGRDLGATG
ncbi:MAG: alpha/beta hydrolase [Paracoccus sp. (in: a-proteobacteria)]|uniref:alpha/beta hydrolase n=1 Tax=Paracoccus sp. TaxID=267 RepID=UPI0039E62A3B